MATTASADTARVVLEGSREGFVTVSVPKSNYRIEFVDASKGQSHPVEGRPFSAIVHAKALKMHRAKGGGTFIEPVEGHPRIVQGRVIATDVVRNMVLVHAAIPMWIAVPQGQAASEFATGDLLNFYVDSGATLRPQTH